MISATPAKLTPAIRVAVKADLPAIMEIYAQPTVDNGKILSFAEAESIYDRMQLYPDYRLYVTECDAGVVGTFALLIMDNLAHLGAPSGIVEDIAVAPSYQRRGIGRAMMQYAWEYCQRRGCYKLTLSANLIREQAHSFYERLGFQRHGYSFSLTTFEPDA